MMGQPTEQVPDVPGTTKLQEGGDCSSYGTGESEEEGEQEFANNLTAASWTEGMEYIKRCMANMDATHTYIVEKLANMDATNTYIVEKLTSLEKLEKSVMAVQEDMAWVRGDVPIVHEVVENLVEHVCTQKPTVVEVEVAPKGVHTPVSAWGDSKLKLPAKNGDPPESMGAEDDDHYKVVHDGGGIATYTLKSWTQRYMRRRSWI